MARHRAEKTCRNKTPLRRGAASAAIAAMLLSGLGASTAVAGAPDTTSTFTTTQEASDVRTMRAVISPKDGGGYKVAFENAESILIEHLPPSHISSLFNGKPVATSIIYYYEATLHGDTELAVEPVTEALQDLPKARTAHVNVLASEPGKFRFSLTVTTHHEADEEVGVETRPVSARLNVGDNEKVTVSFVGTPGIGIKELSTDIASSHHPDQGIRVATTYFHYEVTSDYGTNFDYDIDLNVDEYAELEGAHGARVVTTSHSDDGTMKFFIALSREFPLEADTDEGDEAPDAEPAPVAPEVVTPEPEVTEEAPEVVEAPTDDEVAEEEAAEVITPEVEESAEVDEVPTDEEAPSLTSNFRVSSAQAPTDTSDNDTADTPASIRNRGGADSGGTADSGNSGGGEDTVARPDEAPLVITPGEEFSTSDELAAPAEGGGRVPPTDTRATDDVTAETGEVSEQVAQENLAVTGANGMAGIIAVIITALGGAVLLVRRKLGGVTA